MPSRCAPPHPRNERAGLRLARMTAHLFARARRSRGTPKSRSEAEARSEAAAPLTVEHERSTTPLVHRRRSATKDAHQSEQHAREPQTSEQHVARATTSATSQRKSWSEADRHAAR